MSRLFTHPNTSHTARKAGSGGIKQSPCNSVWDPAGLTMDPRLIVAEDKLQMGAAWFAAIIWNLICIYFWRNILKDKDPWSWWKITEFFFPAIGILLIILAVWLTLQVRKYGEPTLQLEKAPIQLGQTIRGVVEIPKGIQERTPFDWHLKCIRQERTTSRNRPVIDYDLWEERGSIPMQLVHTETLGAARIPIEMTVPKHVSGLELQPDSSTIKWRLTLSAKTAGVSFETHFLLPFISPYALKPEVDEFDQ